MPLFSTIIITYNSSSTIVDCLKSVTDSAEGSEVEIILVDNASPDETKKIIKERFAQLHLIENKTNAGFAAAVNQGAQVANGGYLLLLNPDTKVEKKFFQKVSDFVQANKLAAVTGCNLVDDRGKHQASCWKKPTLGTTLLEMFLPYELSLQMITEDPVLTSEVGMVSGACMAIRRDLFDRLKGFDPQFFMYYEDSDFCYRTRKEGFHIFFNQSINVYHKISGSGGKPETLTMQYYRSKNLFFRKHYGAFYAFTVRMIVLLGVVIRVPAYGIAGIVLFNKKFVDLAKLYWHVLSHAGEIL